MGAPDPLRLRNCEALIEAVGLAVRSRKPPHVVVAKTGLTETTAPGFRVLPAKELTKLEVCNCARYRLPANVAEAWINEGRPQ